MANNCWNYVSFNGDSKVLRLIKSKFDKYDQCNYFQEFGNYILGLNEVGDETWKADENQHYYGYGTKWWDFDIDMLEDSMTITGDSAWSPPIHLIEQICIKYNVIAEMEYEEGGMDFAGTVTMDGTGIISNEEMTYHEYRYKDDVSSWMDNLSFNFEGCDEVELDDIPTDHPYAKKEHIDELIKLIKKMNS